MIVKPANRVAQTEEYYFSKKLKQIAAMNAAGLQVINLGIGSPDQMPATKVIDTLVHASTASDSHRYQSYIGIPELRNAFADWYQKYFKVNLLPDKEILPLIGSKEGIMHISMAFLNPGDEVLVPNPGYPAYRAASQLAGAKVIEYSLDASANWLPNLELLKQQDLSKVKLMWVNYPHMPTGTSAPPSFFEQLINFGKAHQILIVNDNPYSFILNDQQQSLLSIPGAKEVALELNSLSKSHNMAGWRIGMLAGNETYLQYVLRFKSNMDSGMFRPLQLAAVKALQQPGTWYDELNQVYQQRKVIALALMQLLNCVCEKNQVGMFLWGRIPESWSDAYAYSDFLLDQAKVFITPGGIFGSQGNQYLRISLCSNEQVLEAATKRLKIAVQKINEK